MSCAPRDPAFLRRCRPFARPPTRRTCAWATRAATRSRTSAFAQTFRGASLQRAIRDGGLALLVYGPPGGGRYLVVADRRSGAPQHALDLQALLQAPGTPPATREAV